MKFFSNSKDTQLTEINLKLEELLNFIKCLKLSDLGDVSNCLSPKVGDVLAYTGSVWNSVKYNTTTTEGGTTNVEVVPVTTEGIKIADITVNDTTSSLYAPEVTITPKTNFSYGKLKVADIKVGNNTTTLYSGFIPTEALEKTYSELRDLAYDEGLITGQWYLITDYTPIFIANNYYKSDNITRPLYVQALSYDSLCQDAYLLNAYNNTYDWCQVKYESNLYGGLNAIYHTEYVPNSIHNYKGYIYYMKDSYGNEANYDFKGILFNRDNSWEYTFGIGGVDKSTVNVSCRNNKITTSSISLQDAPWIKSGSDNVLKNASYCQISGNYNTLLDCLAIKVNGSYNTFIKCRGDNVKGNFNTITTSDSTLLLGNNYCTLLCDYDTVNLPTNVHHWKNVKILKSSCNLVSDNVHLQLMVLSEISALTKFKVEKHVDEQELELHGTSNDLVCVRTVNLTANLPTTIEFIFYDEELENLINDEDNIPTVVTIEQTSYNNKTITLTKHVDVPES